MDLEQPRLSMAVLASLGTLALLLATIGIHGVPSYSVSQRTREIGIRVPLGATRGSVLRFALRQGAVISAVGVAAGVAGSLACMLLLLAALFATLIPAHRATKVDPMTALRYE